jgi:hypothetical protein
LRVVFRLSISFMAVNIQPMIAGTLTKNFSLSSSGLAREFSPSVVEKIPKAYGGKGPELKDNARVVPLVDDKDGNFFDNRRRELPS